MMSFGLQNITQVGLHKDGLRIGIGAVMVMKKDDPKNKRHRTDYDNGKWHNQDEPKNKKHRTDYDKGKWQQAGSRRPNQTSLGCRVRRFESRKDKQQAWFDSELEKIERSQL